MTDLNEAQRDGVACTTCGRDDAPMAPTGQLLNGVQLFQCAADCTVDQLAESIKRVAAYAAGGPSRNDRIVNGRVKHRYPTNHISRRSAGFVDGVETFNDLLYSDLVTILNAARTEVSPIVEKARQADEVIQKVISKNFRGPLDQADALALFNLHLAIRKDGAR
ncbi:hypothetical protein [Streptosporangium sp. NPDC049078]|uniref:hypothetical protein n=1 Tax=Streptosporangium sp. NPDC049078 TaxID=3155767 RepID=UPI003427257A